MAPNRKTLFLRRKWLKAHAWMIILTILGPSFRLAFGEYSSILDQATVSASVNLPWNYPAKNLINKSFRQVHMTYLTKSVYYTIDLGSF